MPPSATALEAALSNLAGINSKQVHHGFAMLREHYYAEGHALSPEDLARAAGKESFEFANRQYGAFAHKLCDFLNFVPPEADEDGNTRWTYVLATYPGRTNAKGHGLWVLRPEVVAALEALELVQKLIYATPVADIEARRPYLESLSIKDHEQMIRARVGQGIFRDRIIGFWGACSVTGCTAMRLLVASHIKPWRECGLAEATDLANGLLLTPNLDKAFDGGYISFHDTGEIIFSGRLADRDAASLGIARQMRLNRDLLFEQRQYMQYHRTEILMR